MRNLLEIKLFRERLSNKRNVIPTGQGRMVVWVFIGILHIGVREIYRFFKFCTFAREALEGIFHSYDYFSAAFLLLLNDFKLKTLLKVRWRKETCAKHACHVQRVQRLSPSTHSNFRDNCVIQIPL